MSRTIAEIQQEIITAKEADPTLVALDSDSKTAIWRLWAYIVAVSIWALENLFDLHKKEMADMINNTRPFSLQDYAVRAKAFQFGFVLPDGAVDYDNEGLDEQTVEDSRVVKYASVEEILRGVRIKVATSDQDDLTPLDMSQFNAFVAYINKIKSPGLTVDFINQEADKLNLGLNIYFDPLVLNNAGKRLDGTNDQPVQEAINAFLKNQSFNGLFIKLSLLNAIKDVEGVVLVEISGMFVKYGLLNDWVAIGISYQPRAGYLRLAPEDLEINYLPYVGV